MAPGARLRLLGPVGAAVPRGARAARGRGGRLRPCRVGAAGFARRRDRVAPRGDRRPRLDPASLPELRLSLPNKLFEYLLAGVPVLASDLPVLGGFVNEHGVGLVAEPDDPDEVAAKLVELIKPDRNRELRDAVAVAARGAALGPRVPVAGGHLHAKRWPPPTAASTMRSNPTRIRPRLSRTFSRSRWQEYRELPALGARPWLQPRAAGGLGPGRVPEGRRGRRGRVLIMRHDVDQHPRSALDDGRDRVRPGRALLVVLPVAHRPSRSHRRASRARLRGRPAL